MTARDLSPSDFAGLEMQANRHNRFAEAMFAELDEHPCSPKESGLLTALAFLLGVAPVVIVLASAVIRWLS